MIGQISPSLYVDKIAAKAQSDASVPTIIGESESQCARTGTELNALFKVSKDD